MSKGCEASRPRPRDRIIETARDLFRRYGLRGIGVDAIAEAAGTNKMTLYRHFGSKDDLIIAYLTKVAAESDHLWDDFKVAHPNDPMAQLHAWVRAADQCATDGRGCDIANAAVELTEPGHPARKIIEEAKTSHRNRLVELCRAANLSHPELLADTLSLLIEGAKASWQSTGARGPGGRFIESCEAVIASFERKS